MYHPYSSGCVNLLDGRCICLSSHHIAQLGGVTVLRNNTVFTERKHRTREILT